MPGTRLMVYLRRTVKGECVSRKQAVHYLPAKHCHPSTPEPSTIYVACTTQIPLEVQVSEPYVPIVTISLPAVILFACTRSLKRGVLLVE